MNFVALLLLGFEVFFLSRFESRVLRTPITPFNLLAFPYAATSVAAVFLAPILGFIALPAGSLVIWVIGLFVVWIMGSFLTRGLMGSDLARAATTALKLRLNYEAEAVRFAQIIGVMALPIVAFGVWRSVHSSGGWAGIGSPEFKSAMLSGFPAHIGVLCAPVFILLAGTATKRNWLSIVIAVSLMCFFLVGQVKGNVLQPLLGGFFYRVVCGTSSISARSIFIVFLCGVLIFGLVNVFGWAITDSSVMFKSDTYYFLGRYFSFYLLSGTLAFGEAVREGTTDVGGSPASIFAPFINIYRAVTGSGELVPQVSSKGKGVGIDLENQAVEHNSNVYTFFGTLYLYLGPLGSLTYVIYAGILLYSLLLITAWTRNVWLLALHCFIGAQLFLGFFEFYFWHLTTLEVSAYMVALALITARPRRAAIPLAAH